MTRGKRSAGIGFGDQLSKIVGKLKKERRKHADALSAIDDLFAKIGITTHLAEEVRPRADKPARGRPARPGRGAVPGRKPVPGRPGRPSRPAKKSERQKFAATASESILSFVKQGGAKGVTGAEITKHWKTEGRRAGEYVIIGKLVTEKKLKKQKIKGERGSRYTVG